MRTVDSIFSVKRAILAGVAKYYFPFFLFVALLVYSAQHLNFQLPELVNNHLNDLLCMPIILSVCQYAVRYVKSDAQLKIPLLLQLLVTLLFCIYFEYILPKGNPRYTADWVDVLLYGLGVFIFIKMESVKKQARTRQMG